MREGPPPVSLPSKKPTAVNCLLAGAKPTPPCTFAMSAVQNSSAVSFFTPLLTSDRLSTSCWQAFCTAAQLASDPVDDQVGPAVQNPFLRPCQFLYPQSEPRRAVGHSKHTKRSFRHTCTEFRSFELVRASL